MDRKKILLFFFFNSFSDLALFYVQYFIFALCRIMSKNALTRRNFLNVKINEKNIF